MTLDPSIFKDYDIRALVPSQLDEAGIKRIAQAITAYFKPKSVQIGRDMRLTSPQLHQAFINGFLELGVNVVDLGLIATDMLYYASATCSEDLAITISASHNPPEYNGLKIVKQGAIAVSGDSGIYQIRDLAVSEQDLIIKNIKPGTLTQRNILSGWVDHVLKFVGLGKMKPFKVVVDAGNGMAGYFMPAFSKKLPWQVTEIYYDLDGSFPHHIPSPSEEKNMQTTITKVKEVGADVGMAFDGDGDRVVLVDETGRILSGTIMSAIIAENLLQKSPKDTVLYNAIVGRVVPEIIKKYQGKAIRVRVGHTLIKEAMRQYNGLFCGEHSGHYYFRDNFFADSAIIAALLVLELISQKNIPLSQLVKQYDQYPASGEINFMVTDKQAVLKQLELHYQPLAKSIDWLDGVTFWFDSWWANIRASNTESLLRLNLEADNQTILSQKTAELVKFIESNGGKRKL
ncbi:MAG: phosphomannomutase/phosphoglucomutase [Candidatus Beckwithbacteria bacterium]|nr:phosphomannomutase/phosphoglucomutase [Candidatus Beckwithbacteria bacterium]